MDFIQSLHAYHVLLCFRKSLLFHFPEMVLTGRQESTVDRFRNSGSCGDWEVELRLQLDFFASVA